MVGIVVYYEVINREIKIRPIYECRCDERLKTKPKEVYYESIKRDLRTKTEESTRLTDTGLVVELEHLKTKTRLIDKKFGNVTVF